MIRMVLILRLALISNNVKGLNGAVKRIEKFECLKNKMYPNGFVFL